ncbi:MAG TPA: type II toxin-antitoxin system RelE/ParE family toxin [Acidobacteriaceae bacterium]
MAGQPQVILRPAARRDLLESFDYLSREAGVPTAERFLVAVESAANLLAGRPRLGAPCGFSGRISSRFRRLPVPGFENRIIFYLPRRNGADILRVLHGARDLAAILDSNR